MTPMSDWYTYYENSSFVGCNPEALGKAATEEIKRLRASITELAGQLAKHDWLSPAEEQALIERHIAPWTK